MYQSFMIREGSVIICLLWNHITTSFDVGLSSNKQPPTILYHIK